MIIIASDWQNSVGALCLEPGMVTKYDLQNYQENHVRLTYHLII